MQRIGLAGQRFARDNLMSDKLYCYTLKMFTEYSKRQQQQPKVHQGMELIPQPEGEEAKCSCERRKSVDKDEL